MQLEACCMRAMLVVIFLFSFSLSGCTHFQGVQDYGNTLKYNIQGQYYLQGNDFDKGESHFANAVKEQPANAEAHYYYGRFLLAADKNTPARNEFLQAVKLDSDKSIYNFWLGVAYGELGQPGNEKKYYQLAIQYDRTNVLAITYLGNWYLRAKKYRTALEHYTMALELWPNSPQALFNRALVLKNLGRSPEERVAWLEYLTRHPSGKFAKLAANHLNRLGDDSYRNHTLGMRTVTLTKIYFEPLSSKLDMKAYPSLEHLGAVVTNMSKGVLNIVVYQLNNKELARQRALSIRNYLYKEYPELKKQQRIRLSWFSVPETVNVMKKSIQHTESVRFFMSDLEKTFKQ